jgi:toxin YoeB
MTFALYFAEEAKNDLAGLKKTNLQHSKKAKELLKELQEHPGPGTGRLKPLGYGYKDFYSRLITKKHRLVYPINDDKITVLVITTSGHYHDK